MIRLPSYRELNALIVLVCSLALGFALLLEYAYGYLPCPLCMIQRLCVVMLGATATLALLFKVTGLYRQVWAALTGLFALAGAFFSSRQLWLQSLPADAVPACSPGVDYIFNVMPLSKALLFMMQGSGECAEVVWRFLGLSIPGWSLLVFLVLLALTALHFSPRLAD